MAPTIGRTVHYRLFKEQADKMNMRRDDARRNVDKMHGERPGFQAHVGNKLHEGDLFPMVVVQVHSENLVNGQVLLDGNDSLWVTSATEGQDPGNWSWPKRQEDR